GENDDFPPAAPGDWATQAVHRSTFRRGWPGGRRLGFADHSDVDAEVEEMHKVGSELAAAVPSSDSHLGMRAGLPAIAAASPQMRERVSPASTSRLGHGFTLRQAGWPTPMRLAT